MAFIIVQNPDENIWETNPVLQIVSKFIKFKLDEGDERSSNILKAIYFIWDPKSALAKSGMTHEEILKDVNSNILKDENFNWGDYAEIRETYLKTNLSPIESRLRRYQDEIDSLDKMLKDWPWGRKDVIARSSAVKAYKELFEQYMEVADKVQMEHDEAYEMLGGYQKSFIEELGSE